MSTPIRSTSRRAPSGSVNPTSSIAERQRDTHIESDLITYLLAGEPFCRNIAVASDIPYGRISWNFGGYCGMFAALRNGLSHNDPRLRARPDLFEQRAVQRFMGGNLADLIIRTDAGLLNGAGEQLSA